MVATRKIPISGDAQIWHGPVGAILGPMRDASCGRLLAKPQRGGDLTPAVEATQTDLAAHDEAEEQDEGGVLSGQRAPGSSRAGGTPR
jgi:hypothetical protein